MGTNSMTSRDRQRNRASNRSNISAALLAALVATSAVAALRMPPPSGPRAIGALPPGVPPAVARRVPADVTARLVVDDARPGPTFRFLEGDRVTFAVKNPAGSPDAVVVDFRTRGGKDGFVSSLPVDPGEQATVSFTLDEPGLFLYGEKVADPDAGADGLRGLLLVEPLYGFRRADLEFALVLGQAPGEDDALVFNGQVDALTGEGALTALAGGRVRLLVGHAGGAGDARLALSGPVEDLSAQSDTGAGSLGDKAPVLTPGAAGIFEVDLGETGAFQVAVEGAGGTAPVAEFKLVEALVSEEDAAEAEVGTADMSPEMKARMTAGKGVFDKTCIACHQATGLGIPGVYPPLAQSDYLAADVDRAIHGVIHGQQGEITVNGAKYNMLMPPQLLNDEEIAQVMTYVMNSWGNPGGDITVEQVKGVREAGD